MDHTKGLGAKIDDTPALVPSNKTPLVGQYVTLEGIRRDHMPSLFSNLGLAHDKSVFDWLPWSDAMDTEDDLWALLERLRTDRDFVIYAIKADPSRLNPGRNVERDEQIREFEILGTIGYHDISLPNRSLEAGGVLFGKALRRTVAATEAFYLLLRNAFEAPNSTPYRRVAWKCNHLNTASRRAAERLGFIYEGTFRNHMIAKGYSRDSDMLSIVDDEWPDVKEALIEWLDETNFEDGGRQRRTLDEIRGRLKGK